MVKIINGENATLGRLASYVAKEALKGEEIAVVNADKIIITGNRENITREFHEKRERVGSGQKGPKIARTSEKIVKRAIRGMIPEHRWGRGKQAIKRVKCYSGIPREFEKEKMISAGRAKGNKKMTIAELSRSEGRK